MGKTSLSHIIDEIRITAFRSFQNASRLQSPSQIPSGSRHRRLKSWADYANDNEPTGRYATCEEPLETLHANCDA
jgi:hypothetical protein